jgi:hypothetical protein
MKIKTFITLTIISLLFSFSCKETPPEPSNGSKGNGMLIVEDVGVTDAVLRLRVPGGFKSQTITLKRDTTTIFHSSITTHTSLFDTLIIDETLLPKHSYNYTLTVNNFLNTQERYCAGITTMDTTSHNFTWQVDTLGDGNSSILYDVAIVNDTCVYAVGEIYKRDSTGQFENQPYSLAVWNGRRWALNRLYYNGINIIAPIRGIMLFSTTDIWLAAGSVFHWDGVSSQAQLSFSRLTLPNPSATVEKLWGASSSNLFGVGNAGTIIHFNGTWKRLEITPVGGQGEIDVNLADIWGSPDGNVVWACGWEDFKPTVLLKYQNGILTKQYEEYSDRFRIREDSLSGVLIGGRVIQKRSMMILSNYGLYKTGWNTRGEGRRIFETYEGFTGFPFGVAAENINDVIIGGTHGFILHYNGVNFHRYEEATAGNVYFYSADIKENIAAVVGEIYHPYNGKGIVYIGKR